MDTDAGRVLSLQADRVRAEVFPAGAAVHQHRPQRAAESGSLDSGPAGG